MDVFKPVIAAVNGWAVAPGLENALLADIRIVAENAVFGALEPAHQIAELSQGAIRSDKETMLRKDSMRDGARAFRERRKPDWPNHGP